MRALPKVLRTFDVSVLASAAMGPAYSLAATMGPMIAAAGNAAPSALGALCGLMVCMAVAFAALARVAPSAGSSYAWIRMAFGTRAGAYGAWLLLLSNFFATMATAVPAGIYTLELVAPEHASDPLWSALVGALWIAASCLLLYVGIRPTAIVTFAALAFELLVLLAAAVAAAVHAPVAAHAGSPTLPPVGFTGFVAAMTLGVWMSDGWEVSASASEEVEGGDARAAGSGGIRGLIVTTVVLLICMVAFLHLGAAADFAARSDDAMALVGELLGGGVWRLLLIAAVMISTLSTLWTTILYLSRSVYAMGRDGVLPRFLGTLDVRSEPLWALASVGVLVELAQVLIGFSKSAADQLTIVVDGSSVFLGLLFVFSAFACVRRFWGDPMARLRGVIVPLVGAVGLLAVLAATVATQDRTLRITAWLLLAVGIPFALWRGRAKIRPPEESAPAPL